MRKGKRGGQGDREMIISKEHNEMIDITYINIYTGSSTLTAEK